MSKPGLFLLHIWGTACIFLCFTLLLLYACNPKEETGSNENTIQVDSQLMKANKIITRSEKEQIDSFISRYGWKMNETGSGLRYMIYHHTRDIQAVKNMVAVIAYEVRLLNGDIVYSSQSLGNKQFIIGRGGIETGLEEGILYLKKGEKAKFIIPSHLAFGLVGDGNKIPSRAVLVYDVELINLVENK